MASDRRARPVPNDYHRRPGEYEPMHAPAPHRGPGYPCGPSGQYGAPDQAMPAAQPAAGGRSFSVTKVLAGGLAAATSAVCGSYFGLFGTVGGAAVGSVATALSTDLYQRFLEHTRDQFRPRSANRQPTSSSSSPAQYRPAPRTRRRSWPGLVLVSLVLFAIGMGVVSGIERFRGAPLSGGSHGTSVGHLIDGNLGKDVGGGLGSTVDGLLGGSTSSDEDNKSDNSKSDDQTDQNKPKQQHGVVGGLLSGLTGS